jgi:2-polyprenyl-6-methoxyphenol hydroxylase-like FAD-dependent oxidoreductase
MKRRRHVEIVGGGFAGLTAACALAQRGWSVRVHERGDRLRTAGAGINIYENGIRVLEAVGAYEETVRDAFATKKRETRDENDTLLGTHSWDIRVFGIVRQRMIDALAASARRAGAEILTNSEARSATPSGQLTLADGRTLQADLIIAADGVNSKIRDALGLVSYRRFLADGSIRLLIDKTPQEIAQGQDGRTIEYWSGNRRLLYNPCSTTQLYVGLTMLHGDTPAKAVPVRKDVWKASFPFLAPLIERFGDDGRYDRFEYIRLKRWSSGKVAIIGDAAHAIPPNIGQGAGCAMMNALSLAVFLAQNEQVEPALEAWERSERPLTNHTQRISLLFGLPTTWHPKLRALFYSVAARSSWLTKQRTRTAKHRPTGTFGDQAIHHG